MTGESNPFVSRCGLQKASVIKSYANRQIEITSYLHMDCFLSSISKVCLLRAHDDYFAFYSRWLRER
jgi:hypothetical protein